MKKVTSAKNDFNIRSLPATRKEQFSDVLKHNYFLFIKIGFVLLLFLLPYFLSLIVKDVALLTIINSEETDTEKISSMLYTTKIIYNIIVPFMAVIFSIGLSGIMKILKELIYSEPIFFWEDFKSGIKNNKKIILCGLFFGLFSAVANIFMLIMKSQILGVIPAAINYGLIFPICFISLFIIATYSNTFLTDIKTSIILYIKFFPIIVLFYFGFIAMEFIKIIPLSATIIKYAIFFILVVLYYPPLLLASYLYLTSIFDKLINKEQFIEYYRKGLFNDEKKNSSYQRVIKRLRK